MTSKMPLESSAIATTATNSATYLVKSRLRILAPGRFGAATASAAGEPASARPEGVAGSSEIVILRLIYQEDARLSLAAVRQTAPSARRRQIAAPWKAPI